MQAYIRVFSFARVVILLSLIIAQLSPPLFSQENLQRKPLECDHALKGLLAALSSEDYHPQLNVIELLSKAEDDPFAVLKELHETDAKIFDILAGAQLNTLQNEWRTHNVSQEVRKRQLQQLLIPYLWGRAAGVAPLSDLEHRYPWLFHYYTEVIQVDRDEALSTLRSLSRVELSSPAPGSKADIVLDSNLLIRRNRKEDHDATKHKLQWYHNRIRSLLQLELDELRYFVLPWSLHEITLPSAERRSDRLQFHIPEMFQNPFSPEWFLDRHTIAMILRKQQVGTNESNADQEVHKDNLFLAELALASEGRQQPLTFVTQDYGIVRTLEMYSDAVPLEVQKENSLTVTRLNSDAVAPEGQRPSRHLEVSVLSPRRLTFRILLLPVLSR